MWLRRADVGKDGFGQAQKQDLNTPPGKSQLISKGSTPHPLHLSLSVNVSFSLLALDVTVFPSQQREAQKSSLLEVCWQAPFPGQVTLQPALGRGLQQHCFASSVDRLGLRGVANEFYTSAAS